jgi:hypothetical protein
VQRGCTQYQNGIQVPVFGRAALALGFEPSLPKWNQTLDLDAIIPKQEDRADIFEVIRREKFELSTIENAFEEARIPEIEDLQSQFEKAKAWIRSFYRA